MQPPPQAYWDPQRKEIQVVWGIGGRRRHFRLPSHPANLDVLTVEAINDTEVAVFYGREGRRPQWVQVVGIMSGGVHLSINWQAYLSRLTRRAQQQRRREQQECERQRREAEARAREQLEQQRRAVAAQPKTQAGSYGANLPRCRSAPPVSAIRRDVSEPTPSDSYDFECDDCGASVSRQYAVALDVTPKPRRNNRTGWTWLGGLLALIAGLVGFVLSALAANDGRVTGADAFAGLSTLAVVFFGLIGMICPRVGGITVLMFSTVGAGLTGSAGPRTAMVAAFIGGLLLWFGRRNRVRNGTMRKVVRATILAGAVALVIADHVSTSHGRQAVRHRGPRQSRSAGSGNRERSEKRAEARTYGK